MKEIEMSDWMKVSKVTFNQIAKNFNVEGTHSFLVDGVPAGAMVVVDLDGDCYWYDYYVTEEIYYRYEADFSSIL